MSSSTANQGMGKTTSLGTPHSISSSTASSYSNEWSYSEKVKAVCARGRLSDLEHEENFLMNHNKRAEETLVQLDHVFQLADRENEYTNGAFKSAKYETGLVIEIARLKNLIPNKIWNGKKESFGGVLTWSRNQKWLLKSAIKANENYLKQIREAKKKAQQPPPPSTKKSNSPPSKPILPKPQNDPQPQCSSSSSSQRVYTSRQRSSNSSASFEKESGYKIKVTNLPKDEDVLELREKLTSLFGYDSQAKRLPMKVYIGWPNKFSDRYAIITYKFEEDANLAAEEMNRYRLGHLIIGVERV